MNSALFALANIAVGLVIAWCITSDRRGASTEGLFAMRRPPNKSTLDRAEADIPKVR